MWWLDPRDEATFTIHDQFALGDDLIVAPVVERGATTRDIYLTQGQWRDPFAEVYCLLQHALHAQVPLNRLQCCFLLPLKTAA